MKSILGKILVGVALTVVVVFLGRDIIVKASIGGLARMATGLGVSVGGFKSSLTDSSLLIKDLRVNNPSGYTEKTMLHAPEIFVQVEAGTMMSSDRRIKEMRLDVARVVVERNKQGKLNVEELKPVGAKKSGEPKKEEKASKLRIDVLKLRLGKVIYKDATKGITQEFDLNIDETYRNITDVRALTPIIMSNVFKSQALRALANFSPADLMQNFTAAGIDVADFGLGKISGALDAGVGQTAERVVANVADTLGSLFGAAK